MKMLVKLCRNVYLRSHKGDVKEYHYYYRKCVKNWKCEKQEEQEKIGMRESPYEIDRGVRVGRTGKKSNIEELVEIWISSWYGTDELGERIPRYLKPNAHFRTVGSNVNYLVFVWNSNALQLENGLAFSYKGYGSIWISD